MTSSEPLKPCPFCGGDAGLGTVTYSDPVEGIDGTRQRVFHSVNCITCGSDNRGIIGHRTPELAAAHWNTRTARLGAEGLTWRSAALAFGERLASVGPDGYYDMTPEQWLDWAKTPPR